MCWPHFLSSTREAPARVELKVVCRGLNNVLEIVDIGLEVLGPSWFQFEAVLGLDEPQRDKIGKGVGDIPDEHARIVGQLQDLDTGTPLKDVQVVIQSNVGVAAVKVEVEQFQPLEPQGSSRSLIAAIVLDAAEHVASDNQPETLQAWTVSHHAVHEIIKLDGFVKTKMDLQCHTCQLKETNIFFKTKS